MIKKVLKIIILIVFLVVVSVFFVSIGGADNSFEVKLSNTSSSFTLSQGILIVHDSNADFNFFGDLADPELIQLAEIGSVSEFETLVLSDYFNIYETIEVSEISPGGSISIPLEVVEENTFISFFARVEGTNDGFVAIFNEPLFEEGIPIEISKYASNLDVGSEENTPLFSGFEGGQYDPSKGQLNENNGIRTEPQEPVKTHPQLKDGKRHILLFETLIG